MMHGQVGELPLLAYPTPILLEVSLFSIKKKYFFVFFFLGPYPQHMEVPRLGVKSELQPLVYSTAIATWDLSLVCNLHHSSQQHWVLNPPSKARD